MALQSGLFSSAIALRSSDDFVGCVVDNFLYIVLREVCHSPNHNVYKPCRRICLLRSTRKSGPCWRQARDVINLGVGDPDLPTHKFIIDEMAKAIYDPKNHRYPFDEGVPAFRQAAAAFMAKRFGIAGLDADKNIITTIGSKDGIAHLPLAVVNPGDVVLVPQPGYPVYATGTQFAGGIVLIMPLLEKNNFLPDFDVIPEDVKRRTKMVWLNYPNNPTAAAAPLSFYEKAVALAKQYGWVIANDLAYGEVYFEEAPRSILEVPGAMDVAIEFHSLSKSFNMTGWRMGWAVGNPAIIAALGQVKGNVDSGQFNAIQVAGSCGARAITIIRM